MSLNDGAAEEAPRQRRRGEDLENALLDAAWQEFKSVGFYDLTIDAVAQRAGTSRAVLYRRWPGKMEMVAAATRHAILRDRGPKPEPTDDLREDLLSLLQWANRTDVRTMIEATAHLGDYLQRENLTYKDIRDFFLGGKPAALNSPIDAAIARGDIDPAVVTPRVRSLLFDLFRHEVMLNQQPLSDAAMVEIIDDIVMPLLTRKP